VLDIAALPEEPVTAGELNELLQEHLAHGGLFRLDDEGIARSFVDHFFDGNAWKLSLGQLREVVAKLYGCSEDIPSDQIKYRTGSERNCLGLNICLEISWQNYTTGHRKTFQL